METIKIKSKNTCNLFRCILCWKYILPDDSITDYNDGYVHNICNDRRLINKKRYLNHKDAIKQAVQRYCIKHKDKYREYSHNYYIKNRDRLLENKKEYSHNYYIKNRDRLLENKKEYSHNYYHTHKKKSRFSFQSHYFYDSSITNYRRIISQPA